MSRFPLVATWLLAGSLLGCTPSNKVSPPASSAPTPPTTARKVNPDEVPRTDPAQAHRKVQAGQALLVCAYGDDARYQSLKLEGSISLHELESQVPTLARDKEIIFYCA
jgi:hypothetical protein